MTSPTINIPTSTTSTKNRIISSTHGKIEILLVCYFREGFQEQLIEELLKKMEKVKLFILINSVDLKDSLINLIKNLNSQYTFLELNKNNSLYEISKSEERVYILVPENGINWGISRWIQDPFLVMEQDNSSTIKLFDLPNTNDNNLAAKLALAYPKIFSVINHTPNSIDIHGGNVLVGNKHIFIGEEGYERIKEQNPQLTDEKIGSWINNILNTEQKIVFIPPIAHSLKGENSIWNIKEWTDATSPKNVHIDMFLNILELENGGQDLEYHVFIGRFVSLENHDGINSDHSEMEKQFMTIHNCLKGCLIDDKSNATLILHRIDIPKYKLSNNNRVSGYYSNCLIEVFNEDITKINVWMPHFKEAHDKKNKDAWNSSMMKSNIIHSVNVKFIKAPFETMVDRNGALRCITKVLKRGGFQSK